MPLRETGSGRDAHALLPRARVVFGEVTGPNALGIFEHGNQNMMDRFSACVTPIGCETAPAR